MNGSASKDDVAGKEMPGDDDIDDVDDVDRRPSKRALSAPKTKRRRTPIVLVGVAVVAVIAVVAVLLSSGSKSKKPAPAAAAGSTTFTDHAAGFKLSYPSSWVVTHDVDPNVPLHLIIGDPSNLDEVLVRVVPTQGTVNTSNEANIKAVTDAIISGTNVTVLKQQPVTVNGLLGYYYFYSLPPQPSVNVTLVHSHFFLFPPHVMLALTFQTSSTDFGGLASTFDQVINSVFTIPAGS